MLREKKEYRYIAIIYKYTLKNKNIRSKSDFFLFFFIFFQKNKKAPSNRLKML